MTNERRKELFEVYKNKGYKIKVYDYPSLENTDGRRQLRDFAIEDLLYRNTVDVIDEKTAAWYRGKNVMITGGGGSIGSELARQIAKIGPGRLTLLDNYENGVYDIQQELLTRYPGLNLKVEIVNICDADGIQRVLCINTPDIVLHAAAHKHVPLMERNVMEAVKNNVFGTLNMVEACERNGVKRFIMISTDKAVNPTNVMGATKRMCEMIVQSRKGDRTSFSATRFGNVLGSNGSVIPLFRRQIANGGPVTITDKRITRFFMTIPEASQLVMTSGAMAKNGELYVLDMGKPVKIYDLAEEMIRLSGLEPYKDIDIVETGLRPGEKLYEELLIRTEEMDKTENDLIFIERDKPLSEEEIWEKLNILREALATGHNTAVKEALMKVVPTYHTPEEVNGK
ncbi:polysaccharide biosynthesis protein [Aristaeella lactis]|nr:polysaccharide biosynthesis protein [Aristaeella lactis]